MKKNLISEETLYIVIEELEKLYPEAGCALDYDSIFHLVLAVALSAQTTDVSVNKVTPVLFEKYPKATDLANAKLGDVESIIKTIGLYKNKSKNIINLSKVLVERFDGEVPGNFDDLVSLPGVGRKTANVVLSEGFGEQRIAVDTHVFRVANRIGLVSETTPEKTEEALMKRIPHDKWTRVHHLLIFHGRNLCNARKPECNKCPLRKFCIYNINMN